MILERIKGDFCVCREASLPVMPEGARFWFTGVTDNEISLVCPAEYRPGETKLWRAFRVMGQLDFSLIGILAGIADVLAQAGIGIFAVSTYDTDYIFTDADDMEKAEEALTKAGYTFAEAGE